MSAFTLSDESNKKRSRDELSDLQQSKKSRLDITLPEIVPIKGDLIGQLEQLGKNLAIVADEGRMPEREAEDKLNAIKRDIETALTAAFNEANEAIKVKQLEREAATISAMEREENYRKDLQEIHRNFYNKLQGLTTRMTTDLTISQQAQMFDNIIGNITHNLHLAYDATQEKEPNYLARLSELYSILYNYVLSYLSGVLTNIYQSGPEKITQLIAIIAASGIAYNYLPETARGAFEHITTFGPLFTLMNNINPQALRVQNSVATVTSLFYLLRNAGLEPKTAIDALANMTKAITSGTFERVKIGAQSLITGIGNRLTDLLESTYDVTDDYQHLTQDSQESQGVISLASNTSLASSRVVDVNSIPSSLNSLNSIQSMNSSGILLDTPIEEGGISPLYPSTPSTISDPSVPSTPSTQTDEDEPQQKIIQTRFQAIDAAVMGEPAIASEIVEADRTTIQRVLFPVAAYAISNSQVSEGTQGSQNSFMSDITSSSEGEGGWFSSLFYSNRYRGDRRGGKKNKKSRRHMKLRKSKRVKRVKKHITKKGKRHNKTVKRYKAKRR